MTKHKKTTHGGYVIEKISLSEIRTNQNHSYVVDFKRLGQFVSTKPRAICASVFRTHKNEHSQAIDLNRLNVLRPNKQDAYLFDFKSESEIRTRYQPTLTPRQPRLTVPRQRAIVPLSLQNQRPGLEARTISRRTAPTTFM